MRMRRVRSLATLSMVLATGMVMPGRAEAEQVCGCKRLSTGRVNRIVAGAFPTCNLISQAMVCWESAGGGAVSISPGPGLQASPNPIASTGTISVNAPTCAGTDKLTWSGTAFQCATDQTASATLNSYDSGWFAVAANGTYTQTHNLGTTKVIATLYFSSSSDGSSGFYGAGALTSWRNNDQGEVYNGLAISDLTPNTVSVKFGSQLTTDWDGPGMTHFSGYARVVILALQ